jgi:hypothetical protein
MIQNGDMPLHQPVNMQEQSPLGMDLGEFMMESDLDGYK